MIELSHIHKSFNETEVIKGIDLKINQGEVVTLIGRSGSGKTTLLRMINALEIPTEGTVYVNGMTYTAKDKKSQIKVRQQSGMVFQNYNLFKNKTILENITVGLKYGKNYSHAEANEIALSYLNRIDLLKQKDKYPSQLSGGQSQRIGIIRALALNPDVLLLDEPTSALDPESIQSVLSLIKSIAQEGMTMVLVTHEIQFAKAIADQVLFIDDGHIIHRGTPHEVLENTKSKRIQRFLNHVGTERDV
mgnify:CR=1 FL=1